MSTRRFLRAPMGAAAVLLAASSAGAQQSPAPTQDESRFAGVLVTYDRIFKLDIELSPDLQKAMQVSLNLRGEEILYDVKEKKLKAFGRAVPLAPVDGKLVLRILLDRTSIELFGNRGEVTHSGVFYPDPANRSLALTVRAGAARVERLLVRELKSIWSENYPASQR